MGVLEAIAAMARRVGWEALGGLVRGWFGVFSKSLDSVAQQLGVQNIEAEVAGHLSAMQTPMSAGPIADISVRQVAPGTLAV